MTRIHVICEGQTEEMFVNDVLSKVFDPHEIYLYPSLIGKPGHKGGNFKFDRLLMDVKIRLLSDTRSYCTTFFDFYGLPENFPGKKEANSLKDIREKQNIIHQSLILELSRSIDPAFMKRFIPYVQMYEFEGLLFSSPESISSQIGMTHLKEEFEKIRRIFDSPEHINNSFTTAPSKRIKNLFQQYEKVTYGSLISLEIGIDKIRSECNLFNAWIELLKSLEKID
jgi:hypothetical protein